MSVDSNQKPLISIIVAMGRNREIGWKNSLPWDIKEDLLYFKEKTMGKPIIMGQKTFESLKKALPGRKNIVLSLDEKFSCQNCFKVNSIEEALKEAGLVQEVVVIGGESVYRQFLDKADRLYLTLIDSEFQADSFFPEIDFSQWQESMSQKKEIQGYQCFFLVLDKK